MALGPLQAEGDGLIDILPYLPTVALIIVAIALMMWFLAWMSRYFEYLKTIESRWIDRPTFDFVHRVLEALWIAFMIIVVLAIAQTQSPALRGVLAALGLAILGGVRILPSEDQAAIAQNIGTLPAPNLAVVLELLAALVLVLVADRFVNSIFEDLKRRTRKFSQRVLDDFKAITRYAVWLISAVIILFLLLGLVLTADRLVIFAIGFLAFLMLGTVLAFDPARNALAGVTLMRADPFDVGDRVKIGDDLVCDVVSMGLTTTQVRTLRGEQVNLPNTSLVQVPVMNFSRSRPYAISVDGAIDFDVGHEQA